MRALPGLFLRLLPAVVLLALPTARAETIDRRWLEQHYVKSEYRIPMRDGVRLRTAVYAPKDDAQALPILLTRTPYGLRPYGSDSFTSPSGELARFAEDRYLLVFQDVRGRNGSEGVFAEVRPHRPGKTATETDESSDTWDSIDWLVKNLPGNNGRVGIFGVSYPGFYATMALIDAHPALRAASPQAPVTDWFLGDDFHHNGALFLPHAFGFLGGFEQKLEDPVRDSSKPFDYRTPDGYDFYLRLGPLARADEQYFKGAIPFWNEMAAHPNYDAFWQARNPRPHLKGVKCPVLTVGGWFDAEDLYGALETHRALERQNPGLTNLLVMGPWSHGEWAGGAGDQLGPVSFHARTGEYFREQVVAPFFRHFLKDDPKFELPKALVFETGTDRWRRFDAWPPKAATNAVLFLGPGGTVASARPGEGPESFDEFVSDPARPVPHIAGIATGMTREYMIADQRFAATRPDVLVYATGKLEDDLTVMGPVNVTLHVSTTGTDADWVVKLIDVYDEDHPDPEPNPARVRMGGYQQLVRGEPMRGRFRNGFERAEAFQPGQVTTVAWTMPDVCHTFRRGHRLMIQIQSTWFPLVDRNPQTFVENIWRARAEDFRRATHRVYRGGGVASSVSFPVLPRATAP